MNPYEHFAREDDYPSLDVDGASERLAAALALRTVYDTPETTDFGPFDELYRLMERSYPLLARFARLERVGHSVLVTLAGTEPELPCALLLAHQDVVDVVPGTEGEWSFGAFEGHLDEEWIWGRGALDIKEMLMGELEAVELLLSLHGLPRRTIVLAFGEDEEVESHGATALAAELERRGVHAAFALDEGMSTFSDASPYGAPGVTISDVCLSQKGYLDLQITARGQGGHSSNPFGGTSLERLCIAISRLRAACAPPRLTPVVAETFSSLSDAIVGEPLRSLSSDVSRNSDAIALLAAQSRALFPLVSTTMAVDQILGSAPAPNVMPADATAIVNFRLLPGDTDSSIVDWAKRVTCGDVEVKPIHYTPPGRLDEAGGIGYDELVAVMGDYHPGVRVVPSIMCGGADSIRYEAICDKLMRMTPFRPAPEELARGVHGVNERISRRVYAQGIRVLAALLERTSYDAKIASPREPKGI